MRTLLLLSLLSACTQSVGSKTRIEPTAVAVTLAGDMGSEDAVLPFTPDLVTVVATVETFDLNGDHYDYNGDLKIRVRPGHVDMDPWVSLTDGAWTGDVTFRGGFGPTRVWFADEGDKSVESGREPSWSTGVTEPIWYALPTLSEMQTTTDHETNQLVDEFVEFRVADREVVVTALATAGFWATDLSDPVGSFNSLFIYTFNEPRDLVVGDRLGQLSGVNQEYLATTQVSFPVYATAGETLTPPDAVELTSEVACDDLAMEALEGSLVQSTSAGIPSSFVEGSVDYEDYVDYGQWPITIDDCTIYVSSTTAVPSFLPENYAGQSLPLVSGMLSEVWGKWILVVRSAADLGLSTDDSTARRPALPAPRARPTTLSPRSK